MMRRWLVYLSILLCIAACAGGGALNSLRSLKIRMQGEYYLNKHAHAKGIDRFKRYETQYPNLSVVDYYLGRFYLSENKVDNGLLHLNQAVRLAPKEADYYFWRGVAEAAHGNPRAERENYLKALSLDPKQIKAWTYLGHNQLEARQYSAALTSYDKALKLYALNPQAMFNRALCLEILGRQHEAVNAWKAYLTQFHNSAQAASAVDHLNQYGDFEFRSYQIGKRRLAMPQIRFRSNQTIASQSKENLNEVGRVIHGNPELTLHVVVFQHHDATLAKRKALAIKHYLLEHDHTLALQRIQASWFDSQPRITAGDKGFALEAAVLLFTLK